MFFEVALKRSLKVGHPIANINNIIQRAKGEIDNTLLKDEYFYKYLLYHTKFNFILKRSISSNFRTICFKKKNFLSCSKTHFENRRSYCYYKQYCTPS